MPSEHLPTVDQIVIAPERPTLEALDTMLELATRSLLAENPGLHPKPYPTSREAEDPRLALATSALMLARTLKWVLAGYLDHLDHVFRDGNRRGDGDDMPF